MGGFGGDGGKVGRQEGGLFLVFKGDVGGGVFFWEKIERHGQRGDVGMNDVVYGRRRKSRRGEWCCGRCIGGRGARESEDHGIDLVVGIE